jgi:dTDP-4-dehydrorhamnose 3,5-epimerase-like enzyme
MKIPYLINIQKVNSNIGNLSIFEMQKHIQFEAKRIFVLNDVNAEIIRGNHAHKETEQFMLCLQGEINFFAEMPNGKKFYFKLNDSSVGLYIPPNAWHYMEYKKNSIQIVCASHHYDENDYLRTKNEFKNYYL